MTSESGIHVSKRLWLLYGPLRIFDLLFKGHILRYLQIMPIYAGYLMPDGQAVNSLDGLLGLVSMILIFIIVKVH